MDAVRGAADNIASPSGGPLAHLRPFDRLDKAMGCTATIRNAGDVAIVDLSGKFTLGDAAGVIRNCIRSVVDSGHRNVLLNLADVTHMDSAAGLGELIGSYQLVKKMGGDLKLLKAQKSVADVLRITRLDTVFKIYEDEQAALDSFKQLQSRY